MRVLQIINSSQPGGAEKHVLDLIRGLVDKGHHVFVVCREGVISGWYKEAGATVLTSEIGFDIDPKYIFLLKKIISENSIDVVHSHELKASVNALIAAKLAGNVPVVTHIHTPMTEWQIKNSAKKILIKVENNFYCFLVNLIGGYEIALTESRKKVKVTEGISPNKLRVIPNAVEDYLANISSDQKKLYRDEIRVKYNIPLDAVVIGYVSRMTAEKGHETLVKAFATALKVAKDPQNVHLLLAGGGILQNSLSELVASLGVKSQVTITGIFDQKDQVKFYSTLDIFVFPSLAEGFGIVFLEAMVSGLPIISSDLPVLREVGNKDVVYFKVKDSDDLSKHICSLLSETVEYRQELGNKLKQYVAKTYSMQAFVQNYIDLYESFNAGKARSI